MSKSPEHGERDERAEPSARAEPSDDAGEILVLQFEGHIDEKVMRAACNQIRSSAESQGGALVLADLSRMKFIDAQARKVIVQELSSVTVDACAAIGATFQVRVLGMLVTKSLQTITRRRYPLVFFDAEPEGRAWLMKQPRSRQG